MSQTKMDAGASPPNKRRKISPNTQHSVDNGHAETFGAEFSKNASRWNLEQSYEKRHRKEDDKARAHRLPIKTWSGKVEEQETQANRQEIFESAPDAIEEDTPIIEPLHDEPETPEVSVQEQLLSAKEELAKAAGLINESPEEHVGSLKTFSTITSSNNATIVRLGLATQLAVYKDIIPGYRIRPLSQEETKAKVSKVVRKQRAFEQAVVKGYQNYVQDLKRISQQGEANSNRSSSLTDVAIGCACNLLETVPHFNFRSELLSVVIGKLSRRSSSPSFVRCNNALAKLFEDDEDGNASLEAVSMLSRTIKKRDYRIRESVLNLFLHLRLLSEFAQKGSTTRIDRTADGAQSQLKKGKKTRDYRSKGERKLAKERKGIEKEMREADAIVSHEQRDKNQAETLKLVFSTYFHVLKARTPGLMGAVLEGLVKYAHLVNQDFFGDLLEALRDLIQDSYTTDPDAEVDEEEAMEHDVFEDRRLARERLLCGITAFGLLQGQEVSKSTSALGLDLSFFIKHLYQNLFDLAMNPDIEALSKDSRVRDPDSTSQQAGQMARVNVSTTIVLLLRSLRATLLPQNARSVQPVRLAAFSKQLMSASLQLPEKSCTAVLGVLNEVLKTHRGKVNALWNTEERRGDGVFNALHGDVEGSNPFATTVWEGELMRRHFSPGVREGVKNMYSILDSS